MNGTTQDAFVQDLEPADRATVEVPYDQTNLRLGDEQVAEIMRRAREIEGYRLTVDLERLVVEDGRGFTASFAMDEFARHCLMNGLDDIGLTLQHEGEIAAYEAGHPVREEMRELGRT